MSEAIRWWLAVEAIGIVAFPLVYLFFPKLPDRGFAFAKPFGLLAIGFVFWILGSAWVLNNTTGGVAWALMLVAGGSGFVAWKRRDELKAFLKEKWQLLLVIEVLFLLAFIVAAYLRSFTPDIAGTEKPMDFAFLNAATQSKHFPPNDPWLSGHAISYYYGGYLLVAMVGKLAVVDTAIGYNLGLAMIAALAVVGAFGLVLNLVVLHKESVEKKVVRIVGWPLLFGLGAAVLLAVMANLEGLLEFLAAHGAGGKGFWGFIDIKNLTAAQETTSKWYPTDHWWWWRASRIVPADAAETITEFPFFSFLLGDLHPHVMALPFGLLAVAAAVRLLQEEKTLDLWFWTERQWLLVAMAVLVGGLSFFNTWDMPTFFLLLVVAAFMRNYLNGGRLDRAMGKQMLGFAVPLGIMAVLAYIPYHKGFIPAFGFASQADGIAPVQAVKSDTVSQIGTLPLHALIYWAPLAVLVLPFAVQRLVVSLKATPWRRAEWLALAPGLAIVLVWFCWVAVKGTLGDSVADRGVAWITAIILIAVLSTMLLALWRELEARRQAPGSISVLVALLAGTLAVLLVLGAEFFYVRDVFDNRMNTVFKLYYQAWLLMAIAGGFALYYLSTRWFQTKSVGAGWRVSWAVAAALILAAGLAYPVGATFSQTEDFGGKRSLDGLAWARSVYPDDYAMAQWLIKNADPADVIVETAGGGSVNYEYGPAGRIAAWTGMSTVLAWPGHERQWRGSDAPYDGRLDDINKLYTTANLQEVIEVINKYGIDYIYVGQLEKDVYPAVSLEKFEQMFPVAQRSADGNAVVYKTGTSATEAR